MRGSTVHFANPRFILPFCAVAMTIVAQVAAAATPPAGSPLANRQHPRLFFTAADIPSLRSRIATLYKAEFQELLDIMANPSGRLNRNHMAVEANWGAVNYAFVAALDPNALRQAGFNLPSAYDTPGELCSAALAYAAKLLPGIAAGKNGGHSIFSVGYPNPSQLPVALAYDWCHAHSSAADRTAIANAFVDGFNRMYAGQDYASMPLHVNNWIANNANSAGIHDLLGVLAIWGDAHPSSATQQSMYDAFHAIWLERLRFELDSFYGDAANWHEGPGPYYQEGFMNLAFPVAAFSTALAKDYVSATPFFTTSPKFVHAILNPQNVLPRCGGGSAPCPTYLMRFGEGDLHRPACKTLALMSGVLRKSSPRDASLAKWLFEQRQPSCAKEIAKDGGNWTNGVLYWYLLGDRDVSSAPPAGGWTPLEKLGLGQYVFTNERASQVAFFAQPYGMYGHGMNGYGHFTIHKYGELILTPGNSKGGDARIKGTGFNVMQNTMGVHKGASDQNLAEDGKLADPLFRQRGLTMRRTGEVKAETLGATFAHVFFDSTATWAPSTADLAHREFAYLKGPENSEYVILFDRIRTVNPAADEKIWKAWLPNVPRFEGSVSTPRSGKVTSTGKVAEVTNQLGALKTQFYESAPTHGRLFVRSLAPDDAQLSFIGGPGHEFQSGNDDGAMPWGTPAMTDAMRAYLGTGRLEIRPAANRSYDTFLTVMQFGDAHSLTAMTPALKVRSGDGLATGVHVRDAAKEWVVMFAETPEAVFALDNVSYSFQPASGRSSHLLFDMVPGRQYYITRTSGGSGTMVTVGSTRGAGSIAATASAQGVVQFELSGLNVVVPTPPSAPRNLRIVSGN